MKMKVVNKRERYIIAEYFLQFTVDINDLEGVLVCIGKKVFLVDRRLWKVAKGINREYGVTPYAVGTEIGTVGEGFEPSIELAGILVEYTGAKTVINEKGEKLFTYGRDVFEQNIVDGKEEGMRIVINNKKEVLGFGFFDGNMLNNVVDKGFYLRGKKGRR
jgi:60S ribosome subunit biogenesis protein NIP7